MMMRVLLAFTTASGLAGGGVLVLILLIGVASFGVFWVFTHSRRYD